MARHNTTPTSQLSALADGAVGADEVRSADSEEALHRGRDLYRHLFETVVEQFPHPVGVVNRDGITAGWNEELGSLLGIPAEDA